MPKEPVDLGEGYTIEESESDGGKKFFCFNGQKIDPRMPEWKERLDKARELARSKGIQDREFITDGADPSGFRKPERTIKPEELKELVTEGRERIGNLGRPGRSAMLFTEEAEEEAEKTGLVTNFTTVALRKAGASEQTLGGVGTAFKAGGAVLGTYFSLKEVWKDADKLDNGTPYTKLLDVSGVAADSAVRRSDENSREKDLLGSSVGAIPTMPTKAFGFMESGLRWLAGDAPHGALLARVIARDESGTSHQEKWNAVRDYVDSALGYFHYLSDDKQKNIINNIMTMRTNGQLKNWGQLPGLIGNDDNIGYLQKDPKFFNSRDYVNPESLKLPDAEKTAEALKEPEFREDIEKAVDVEARRKLAGVPDIDWKTARDRLMDGGRDAYMAYMTGQFSAPGWKDIKGGAIEMIKAFDTDTFYETAHNAWNRPLDLMTGAMARNINKAKGNEDVVPHLSVLNPQTGEAYQLTRQQIEDIRNNPPDPNRPDIKLMRLDEQGHVTSTTLDREELDKILSGQKPYTASPEDINRALAAQKPNTQSDVKDAPAASVEELQTKAEAIAKEKDPAKKAALQEDFNDAYATTDEKTRKDYILQESDTAQNQAVTGFIESEKAKNRQPGSGELTRMTNEDLAHVDELNKAKAEREKYYYIDSGLRGTTFMTSRGQVTCSQEIRYDERGRPLSYVIATMPGGEQTYVRINDKEPQAYTKYADGTLVPMKATDAEILREMLAASQMAAVTDAKPARPRM